MKISSLEEPEQFHVVEVREIIAIIQAEVGQLQKLLISLPRRQIQFMESPVL